jgi:hypothetical protein
MGEDSTGKAIPLNKTREQIGSGNRRSRSKKHRVRYDFPAISSGQTAAFIHPVVDLKGKLLQLFNCQSVIFFRKFQAEVVDNFNRAPGCLLLRGMEN